MSGDQSQFHDPELKARVIRARGGHTASAELRSKVMARLATVRAEMGETDKGTNGTPVPLMRLAGADAGGEPRDSIKLPTASKGKPWYLTRTFFAAAAVLMLMIGGASMYFNHLQHEAEEREEYLENNRPLLLAMIGALDGKCDADPSHQVIADPGDPRVLARDLSKQLGREVPPVNMTGWKVEQVSICQVGPAKAAHWQMTKNGKRMTVLSLPKTAFNIEEYEDYDFRLNDHAIAGFLRHDSINCIVCEPSVSDREAIRLRDELKRG